MNNNPPAHPQVEIAVDLCFPLQMSGDDRAEWIYSRFLRFFQIAVNGDVVTVKSLDSFV